jgi:hypothetical protein
MHQWKYGEGEGEEEVEERRKMERKIGKRRDQPPPLQSCSESATVRGWLYITATGK